MSDPKLLHSSVKIDYRADDGYSTQWRIGRSQAAEAHIALLEGLEELARLTALFGFEAEALERFNAARKRVADWRAARGEPK